MVFYRKYRPQKIDELDSSSVRETLFPVLQKNIPHAFLFTGPKGLGKTSTARIVAKVVNCETAKTKREKGLEPCNICDQCVSITNGNNVDILEIDAASNRGIDEIRELKEKIRLAPVAAKRKVYIIDEVHMLTTEAFNALLKTLEEPPEHAMFILCTTESHKVPETIVSRCFQIMFKPATQQEIVRSLERIAKEEKLTIVKDVFPLIAERAEGGFRDAVKMLEEMALMVESSKSKKEINEESLEQLYKVVSISTSVNKFFWHLNSKDVKGSLQLIDSLVKDGINIKDFINHVMNRLHVFLYRKVVDENYSNPSDPEFSINEIKSLAELFSKAALEMKTAVLPQLPLELAVIEWCEDKSKVQTLPAGRQSANLKVSEEVSYTANDEAEVSVTSLRKQVGTIKKLKALYGEKKVEYKEPEVTITTTSVELMQTNGNGPVTKEWMDLFWKNLIGEMRKYNHTIAGVLRGCTIKSYGDQTLIIQTAYKFHKERLDDMKNHEALLRISKLLTGKDVAITVELKK
jgi:DNA polymerase III subunit gamma/tau